MSQEDRRMRISLHLSENQNEVQKQIENCADILFRPLLIGMGIDRILDMARTAVNITGDAVCTTVVAHQNQALDKSVFNQDN